MFKMSRKQYADMYGPTTGDRVCLGDTSLVIEVEKDYCIYGEDCPDNVITSVLVVDSTGIYKADIGIKDGKICGIGKSGNPDIMDGVTPSLVFGAGKEAIA